MEYRKELEVVCTDLSTEHKVRGDGIAQGVERQTQEAGHGEYRAGLHDNITD